MTSDENTNLVKSITDALMRALQEGKIARIVALAGMTAIVGAYREKAEG
jgi:hypothetical protein